MSINKKLSTTYPRYVDYFMLSEVLALMLMNCESCEAAEQFMNCLTYLLSTTYSFIISIYRK